MFQVTANDGTIDHQGINDIHMFEFQEDPYQFFFWQIKDWGAIVLITPIFITDYSFRFP